MPLQVGSQAVGGLVTPGAILLQALHHNPIQIAAHGADEFFRR
jgi:hypothetical protein